MTMRVLIKKILIFFANVARLLYPYSFSFKLRTYRNYFYTNWIKNSLGEVGASTIIEKPCQLIGGGNSKISIGSNTCIQANSVLGCWSKHNNHIYNPFIKIGNHCSFGEYNHLSCINGIEIGDGLLTGRFVIISDNNHGDFSLDNADVIPGDRELKSKGKIIIGNNCWIGDKATILGGITIGNNVIIAANSVVTHSLPSNCIAAGVPARIIKQL